MKINSNYILLQKSKLQQKIQLAVSINSKSKPGRVSLFPVGQLLQQERTDELESCTVEDIMICFVFHAL